ncbi:RhuM family protein [Acidithiobacillus ferrivorans]|uniref:RhuM family protein n=1 Tax=Acidithiobacillus ferrivorans TaxID=160808 RepID=UPI003AA82184
MPNSSSRGGREVTREVEHYNLDMILALGFRVRSPVGVRFRQWAGCCWMTSVSSRISTAWCSSYPQRSRRDEVPCRRGANKHRIVKSVLHRPPQCLDPADRPLQYQRQPIGTSC